MKKVGVIIQRFGEDIIGGSEYYALQLLKNMSSDYSFIVYTTTAKDYLTWKNEYEEGEEKLTDNILIKRFKVEKTRNIDEFNKYSEKFFSIKEHSKEEEEEWIRRQGPLVPSLIEAVGKEQEKYDLFFLFTYLYYPVYFSIPIIKKPKLLFPTTHDELPLYMKIMKRTFELPEAILALTGKELELINKVFPKKGNQIRKLVGGIGIEPPNKIDTNAFLKKYTPIEPFIIYIGRIDGGKGVDFLIENFLEFSKKNYVQLVLGGKRNMDLPSDFRVKYLGFLSEEEKWEALKSATLYVHPSQFESLSISMLEAMAVGTPVFVNGNSPVMKEHILKSNAGLYYTTREEFLEGLSFLMGNIKLREKMGENGIAYVKKNYSWKNILDRIEKVISLF